MVINQSNALISLIKEAGQIMTGVHGVSKITEKGGTANFVTEYDVKVQTFLIEGIKKLYPKAEFFS